MNNIILAGVARSGSTLTCHLLNKTPDVVALHEPINPSLVPMRQTEETLAYIKNFFEEQRHSLLTEGVAKSKSRKGKVPDNPMGGLNDKTGKRERVLDGNQITVSKALANDFSLVIKQPGLFTGMLGLLKEHFPCYATVRNPLAVLRSWNTVDMAVTDGHAPAAEQCDAKLKATLAKENDVFQRQVILLSWYYEQFYKHIDKENIIFYEDVIRSGGGAISCITPSALNLKEELSSKNSNALYDVSLKDKLANYLLNYDGCYWQYYSRNDVSELMKNS